MVQHWGQDGVCNRQYTHSHRVALFSILPRSSSFLELAVFAHEVGAGSHKENMLVFDVAGTLARISESLTTSTWSFYGLRPRQPPFLLEDTRAPKN